MNQYKYFFASDLKKEQIGKVKAKNLEEAYLKASHKKRLQLEHFKQLFDIEEIK
jgi:hypothetical protein